MRRRIQALLVVGLVVLSGCTMGGSTGTASSTETVESTAATDADSAEGNAAPDTAAPTATPTPTPTATATATRTPTATPDSVPAGLEPLSAMELPRGVSDDRVDAVTLAAGVETRVETTDIRMDAWVENRTETLLNARVDDAGNRTFMRYQTAQATREAYVSDTEAAVRVNRERVWHGDGPTMVRSFGAETVQWPVVVVQRYVRAVNLDAVGVRETDDGDRVVLNVTGASADTAPQSGATLVGASGELAVTSEGRIAEGAVALTVEADNETETQTLSVRTELRDREFVSRPAWVDRAPKLEVETVADDRLLAVTNAGDETLRSGTPVSVNESDQLVGVAQAIGDIESGETFYVYRVETDDGVLAHYGTDSRSAPDEAVPYQGTVFVSTRIDGDVAQAGTEVETESDG